MSIWPHYLDLLTYWCRISTHLEFESNYWHWMMTKSIEAIVSRGWKESQIFRLFNLGCRHRCLEPGCTDLWKPCWWAWRGTVQDQGLLQLGIPGNSWGREGEKCYYKKVVSVILLALESWERWRLDKGHFNMLQHYKSFWITFFPP